jgi:hypothetical protein
MPTDASNGEQLTRTAQTRLDKDLQQIQIPVLAIMVDVCFCITPLMHSGFDPCTANAVRSPGSCVQLLCITQH